jgi:hypothetical protein
LNEGYASKDDLKEALRESAEWITSMLLGELGNRFNEVNQRLDRIDATLVNHGKQIAAGARAIAGFNEWTSKADADYVRVLAELSELKTRVQKLESQ